MDLLLGGASMLPFTRLGEVSNAVQSWFLVLTPKEDRVMTKKIPIFAGDYDVVLGR